MPTIAAAFDVLELEQSPRETLEQIDRAIDWSQFDRYLIWLSAGPQERRLRAPVMLFKALLLKQWFKLRAIDFDFDIADRLSFRRFIGLRDGEPPPTYDEVKGFADRLVARAIDTELYAELQAQFLRSDLGRVLVKSGRGLATGPAEFAVFHCDARPAEWLEIEQRFLDFWDHLRGGKSLPSMDDFRFSDIPDLMPHTALIRVLEQEEGFCYEFMGETLAAGNGGSTVGMTIESKMATNFREYGHAGFQGQLFKLFKKTLKAEGPVSTSEYFANAAGRKCQIWIVVAPIGDKSGSPEILFSAAWIKPVSIN
ncbi:MAG: hypothetical protein GVY13_14600 [Alphaproteobacteria bacterium]|jgi:hypothetical protein|nr:hypothetical protein [Alphaproteobacteria bacterium]